MEPPLKAVDYVPPCSEKSKWKIILISLLVTVSIFVLIPIMQFIAIGQQGPREESVETFALLAPEPPPPEEPPPPDEPPPELEEEPPPPPKLTLEQIELSLNPGAGDLGGDFSMPGFNTDQDSLGTLDIFSIEDLDDVPKVLSQIAPMYPLRLRQSKVQGRAVIMFVVDTSGRVIDAQVESATHAEFGDSALRAISKWRFEPGQREGQAVKFRMRIPIPFRL
jgi:protein TonB